MEGSQDGEAERILVGWQLPSLALLALNKGKGQEQAEGGDQPLEV